jgi:hypothetical protein
LPREQDSCRHEELAVSSYSIYQPVVGISALFKIISELTVPGGLWVEVLFTGGCIVVVFVFFILILVFFVIEVRILILTIP